VLCSPAGNSYKWSPKAYLCVCLYLKRQFPLQCHEFLKTRSFQNTIFADGLLSSAFSSHSMAECVSERSLSGRVAATQLTHSLSLSSLHPRSLPRRSQSLNSLNSLNSLTQLTQSRRQQTSTSFTTTTSYSLSYPQLKNGKSVFPMCEIERIVRFVLCGDCGGVCLFAWTILRSLHTHFVASTSACPYTMVIAVVREGGHV
jgi:hypothetical protein